MLSKKEKEKKENYVLNLIEDNQFSYVRGTLIGYWTGKRFFSEDIWFPGVKENKYDEGVKVYTSKKRAENAVSKLKGKFTYINDARIEVLEE